PLASPLRFRVRARENIDFSGGNLPCRAPGPPPGGAFGHDRYQDECRAAGRAVAADDTQPEPAGAAIAGLRAAASGDGSLRPLHQPLCAAPPDRTSLAEAQWRAALHQPDDLASRGLSGDRTSRLAAVSRSCEL